MNRHKLVLSSTVVIAIILFGLTPKLVGMNLRDTSVANLFALIPPEYERQLEINETRFDSGWFGSSAQFDIEYSALGLEEPLSLRLDFDFDHGPLLITRQGLRLGWAHASITPAFNSRDVTEVFSEIPFDLPELELNLVTGFNQTLTVELVIAPASVAESGITVNFEGLTGTLVAYSDRSAQINVAMGSLSAGEGANEFSIESLDLDSHTEQLNDLLAPSTAEVLIPTLSATGAAAFIATDISSLSRLSSTPDNNQQINFYQKFNVANVESELPLQSLTWISEINEVSTELIRTYYELLASVQTEISRTGSSTAEPDLDQLAQQLLLELIRNSLVFNNSIEANVYGGDHSIELLINWLGLGLPKAGSTADLDFEQVISATEAELHMSLNLEAIARSPFAAMIDPYVQQGYITLDNGRVLLDITLADEQLVVNGDITPLGNFSIQQNL